MRRILLFTSWLVAVLLAIASRAEAFERQWHAGLDAGFAALSWNDELRSGLGGGLHAAYGLTDSYNALLEVGVSSHSVVAGQPMLVASHAALGMAYTLDVVSWVPYVGLLVGGYQLSGFELRQAEYRLGFQAALGFDFRPSRSWAVGAQLRYHTFAQEPLQAHYMTTFLRFEWLWGW